MYRGLKIINPQVGQTLTVRNNDDVFGTTKIVKVLKTVVKCDNGNSYHYPGGGIHKKAGQKWIDYSWVEQEE